MYATGSSIKAIILYISQTGYYDGTNISFISNRADKGGRLSLEGSTKLYIMKYGANYYRRNPLPYSAIVFEENMAT